VSDCFCLAHGETDNPVESLAVHQSEHGVRRFSRSDLLSACDDRMMNTKLYKHRFAHAALKDAPDQRENQVARQPGVSTSAPRERRVYFWGRRAVHPSDRRYKESFVLKEVLRPKETFI
jgi:hypothetical protein